MTVTRHARGVAVACVAALLLAAVPAGAHDVPRRTVMQAFVRPEGDRLHVLLRLPLILLLNLDLPKRGPGYLDLARIDPALAAATAAVGREVLLFEDGRRLSAGRAAARVSLASDRAFASYATARAHVAGPLLPVDTDVFWNQGFLDVHLEYAIASPRSAFALETRVAPDLGEHLRLAVRFLGPDGATRAYELTSRSGRVALDPRWFQAAWRFVQGGVAHILTGADHLLFLLCVVIPVRRLASLLAIVTSFTVAHSITLIAATYDLAPVGPWFPPLVETLIALSIVYMALENLVGVGARRRWLVTGLFGLVHGFGFAFGLKEYLQFAGAHLLLSLLSFNVGVELGQILVLLVTVPALAWGFRRLPTERWGVVIASALIAHQGWHWMVDRAQILWQTEWPTLDASAALSLARWAALAVAGLAAWGYLRRRTPRGVGHVPGPGPAVSEGPSAVDRNVA